jgi:hypothetical protein
MDIAQISKDKNHCITKTKTKSLEMVVYADSMGRTV